MFQIPRQLLLSSNEIDMSCTKTFWSKFHLVKEGKSDHFRESARSFVSLNHVISWLFYLLTLRIQGQSIKHPIPNAVRNLPFLLRFQLVHSQQSQDHDPGFCVLIVPMVSRVNTDLSCPTL